MRLCFWSCTALRPQCSPQGFLQSDTEMEHKRHNPDSNRISNSFYEAERVSGIFKH
ncbi:UNVERIFIED_CONTAM: hypothetical protein FKN15_063728 [Acipenser sinensis]